MVLLDNRTFDTMPLIIETLKRKDPVVETDRKTLNLEESKKSGEHRSHVSGIFGL